jgi:hypothetical protein
MWYDSRAGETVLLIAFIVLAAVLALVVVPAGISASRMPGVTPRTVPYGVAAGIALLCLIRLAALWIVPQSLAGASEVVASDPEADLEPDSEPEEERYTGRLALIVAGCFLFSALLVPYLGFYLAGISFVAGIMGILGERRLRFLVLVPTGLALAIYVLFEMGFSIRLPKGTLLLGWFGG